MSLYFAYLACARSCLGACGELSCDRKVLSIAPWSVIAIRPTSGCSTGEWKW